MADFEEEILRHLREGETFVLATITGHQGSTPRTAGSRMAVLRDGRIFGTIGGGIVEARAIEAAREVFETGRTIERDFDLTHQIADTMDMICGGRLTVRLERVKPAPETIDRFRAMAEAARKGRKTVYLFGAGHVSREVAVLARRVGFGIIVLDDRVEFASRERFPDADGVTVLETFESAFRDLPVDGNGFIVILTRGHAHDKTVLAGALRTDARYIGMIGSKRKRAAIYAALEDEGFTRADLDRVYSPIGIAIGAETPEEIAVSIVAELIQVRAKGEGR